VPDDCHTAQTSPVTRVAVIGLGAMGLPLARLLTEIGVETCGYDLSPERRAGAPSLASTIPACIKGCEVVLLSLPTSREVEAVVRGEILPNAEPGQTIVDLSTAEPGSSRVLQRECAEKGLGYVDAPVSGGPAGAAAGKLLVMAGGAPGDVERALPVLQKISRQVLRCGGPGTGNVVKLVNNLLCAANLVLAGEALRLGEASGVDPEVLAGALAVGSGRSGVTELNLPTWVLSDRFDSGFTMGLMRKDVRLAAVMAGEAGGLGRLSAAAVEAWAAAAGVLPDGEDFNRMVELAWGRRAGEGGR
jgi:3-hydroxyisobutyrate dehydrogenase